MNMRRVIVASVLTAAFVFAPISIVTTAAFASPPSGNEVAVCACGKVFTPTAATKYVEHDGERFACCSDECHMMAAKQPAQVAQMAKAKAAVMMHKVQTPVTVANVVEVGKEGAVAICGCGHKAAVNASTAYLEVGDKTYAACSEGCKAHMAKDADKSAEMIEAKVAEYHHNH